MSLRQYIIFEYMNDTSINLYDYNLPKELIASEPLDQREQSKLLHLAHNSMQAYERKFYDLLEVLNPGDLLILNNTRVIPARINMHKDTGGKIEILFHRKISNDICEAIFSSSRPPQINALLSVDSNATFKVLSLNKNILTLESIDKHSIFELFEKYGEVPLPKYIKRPASHNDKSKYQTVYAELNGSVAAPTAGLHFSDDMIKKLIRKGINIKFITLHISYNTFKPITSESYLNHEIGSEYINIEDDIFSLINETKNSRKRVIAVGTTVTRAIEYCYTNNIQKSYDGPADLFIYPGYNFLAVDCIITNFHLPKSSLLLLVCAFFGKDRILDAYKFAVKNNYRFYSYGDCMFLER